MFVKITGVVLKEQLGGDTMIDHELMSVIIHRYGQADQEADEAADIGALYGDKLKLPITKHNVSKSKSEALHECMKLQGNFSSLAREALRHVLAPSDSAFDTS